MTLQLPAKRERMNQSRHQLCSWKDELSGIGSMASFSAVLAFLDFFSPSKLYENHNIRYQKREHNRAVLILSKEQASAVSFLTEVSPMT